jgi:hypothetical protein
MWRAVEMDGGYGPTFSLGLPTVLTTISLSILSILSIPSILSTLQRKK